MIRDGEWRDVRCAALRAQIPGTHVLGCSCSDRPGVKPGDVCGPFKIGERPIEIVFPQVKR